MSDSTQRDVWGQSPLMNEMIRSEILRILYGARPNESSDSFIGLNLREYLSTESREQRELIVMSELQFLIDLGLIQWSYSPLSALKRYRITAGGILMVERDYPHFFLPKQSSQPHPATKHPAKTPKPKASLRRKSP